MHGGHDRTAIASLPVVENGELIGLLSIGDLVKEAIVEQADLIASLNITFAGTTRCQRNTKGAKGG